VYLQMGTLVATEISARRDSLVPREILQRLVISTWKEEEQCLSSSTDARNAAK
jgi:hypothetical protein